MSRSFFFGTDARLYTGSQMFSTKISANPIAFGLVFTQAMAYSSLNSVFGLAYITAIDPDSRTKANVAIKNDARKALKKMAAELAAIIDATPSVTDGQKIDLGLGIRKTPSSRRAPDSAPTIDVLSALGRTLKLRLHDDNTSRRGRPEGTDGVTVMAFVGTSPSNNSQDWKFMGNFNKTTFDITFEGTVLPGTTVWLSAFWVGAKLASGPASIPIPVNLPGNVSMAA